MKVTVLRRFTDKHTKETYFPGDILEVSEERAAEMRAASLVPLVEDPAEVPVAESAVDPVTESAAEPDVEPAKPNPAKKQK